MQETSLRTITGDSDVVQEREREIERERERERCRCECETRCFIANKTTDDRVPRADEKAE